MNVANVQMLPVSNTQWGAKEKRVGRGFRMVEVRQLEPCVRKNWGNIILI